MALSIVNARLPTGDTPICGVTLEPYIVCRRGDTNTTADDVPEEGVRDGPLQLRCRWYRSTLSRGGQVCCVHPEAEAALQCLLCLRLKAPTHLSFHCSADCMKKHWQAHREYHSAAAAAENRRRTENGGVENGHGDKPVSTTYSNTVDSTWVEVSRTRRYTPGPEDVGYALRLDVSVADSRSGCDLGKPIVVNSSRVRPAPSPPLRPMLPLPPPPGGHFASGRFTVLTYNLLADLYAKPDLFSYCPSYALAWQYRKRNLLRELLAYRPDILCLQEVQSDHFADFLSAELQRAGYSAIYKKKTTELFTGSASYAIDGCATFFRRDKFTLVKKYEVEFNKAALSLSESMTHPGQRKAALNRLLKDNVALIAVLEALDPPHPAAAAARRQLVCVANTHIHANPELHDVKLWQVHTLLKGLEKIAASADIPMIVAGDFNSMPGSPPHSLLTKGRLDRPTLDAANDPMGILKDQKLFHSLPLASAYAALAEAGGADPRDPRLARQRARLDPKTKEPLFTISTRDFKGTLDYVLYTRDSLAPVGLLELPAEGELNAGAGGGPDGLLPNPNWSSDHIALMVEFQYTRH